MKNPATTAFVGTQVYAAMEAKKELEKQKEDAERVCAALRRGGAECIRYETSR
jgi:hypothetical protein